MLRRHQHIQQGHDVKHLAAVDQLGFFTYLSRDLQGAQLFLQRQQAGSPAGQHHHTGWFYSAGDLTGHPGCGLPGFQRAQRFFG